MGWRAGWRAPGSSLVVHPVKRGGGKGPGQVLGAPLRDLEGLVAGGGPPAVAG